MKTNRLIEKLFFIKPFLSSRYPQITDNKTDIFFREKQ